MIFREKIKLHKILFSIMAAILVLSVWVWQVFALVPDGKLHVWFFDVGQGDAMLIKTPAGEKIIIDGGPGKAVLEPLGKTLSFFDQKLDLLILTHPHADHLDGLVEILKRYKVEKVLSTGVLHTTPEFEEWLSLIKNNAIPFKTARAGDNFSLGEVNFYVLSPEDNLTGQKVEDLNDTSLIIKMVFGHNSFLFMGDAAASLQKSLLDKKVDVSAGVLKVPHHGSKDSIDENFINAVNPAAAIISVGKNSFGHPAPLTLEKLESLEIKTYRTDQNGTIEIVADGENLEIFKER